MNLTSAQLLDSNAAVASLYAVERLKGNATVLFIDIGASQTEFSLWSFEQQNSVMNITLKDFRYSDQIGGRVIDQLLLEKVIAGLNRVPTKAERVTMLRNIRKVKETLAAGGDYVIDLSEDFQKVITLSNDVMAEVASPVLKKLNELIEGIESPDEIEMVGGASRLPSFVSVIQNAFPNLPLRRSLNSDEAIATGAAYYASLQTGTIAGTRLEFHRPAMYGLNLKALDQTFELFRRGELFERKYVSLRRFRDFSFEVELSPEKARSLRIQSSLYDRAPIQFKFIAITGLTNLTRNVTKQLAVGTRPYVQFAFGRSEVLDCPDFIWAS
jgi:molecular chaperone DnaK (HSP70)